MNAGLGQLVECAVADGGERNRDEGVDRGERGHDVEELNHAEGVARLEASE